MTTLIGSPVVSIFPLMLAGQIWPTGGVASAVVATTVPTTPENRPIRRSGASHLGTLIVKVFPHFQLGNAPNLGLG